MIRTALIVGCLTLSVLGCQRPVEGAPEPGSLVDTLPLSNSAVKDLSGFDRLTREVDSDQPTRDTYLTDGPCHAMADQHIAYGDVWTGFRSIADTADLTDGPLSPIVSVTQNLVAYPDDAAARAVFDRQAAAMADCAALNMLGLEGAVVRPDSETAVWVNEWKATVFVIKAAFLVDVSVVALPDAERVASDISRAIVDRIE